MITEVHLSGAIYTDKNLLLLNVPECSQDILYSDDSADISLRENITSLNPDTGPESLRDLLKNQAFWKEQSEIRKQLRTKYFAPYYGYAANVTAGVLNNLDTIFLFDIDSDESLYNKAVTLIKNEDYKPAIAILTKLVQKNYRVPEIFHFIKLCLRNNPETKS